MSADKLENLIGLIQMARKNLDTYTDEEREKLLLSFKEDLENLKKESNDSNNFCSLILKFLSE